MPTSCLALYFAPYEVGPDFDITAMKEPEIDALLDARMAFQEASHTEMERELSEIRGIVHEKGYSQ